jgi:uncharacterized protein (TIGR00251 family)
MVTILRLRVTPNSSHNSVVGEVSDEIRIKIRAPAVAGKANAALVEYLAELTGIAKSRIEIKAGARTRTKLVQFEGIRLMQLRRRLGVDA